MYPFREWKNGFADHRAAHLQPEINTDNRNYR